jgi:hypothetical protein
MSKLLATTLTVFAVTGCAASTPPAPVDEEPPSSRVLGALSGLPTEKTFDITKPGDPRPTTSVSVCGERWPPPTNAWPDGDPKSDPISTSDLVFNPPTGFTADVEPQ